ncbi:MAG TPA: ABC transporter permease [Ilumatobacteraceae bacterium]|nr:ABC transporter permease [Ilumatobacteraceae bacterium]
MSVQGIAVAGSDDAAQDLAAQHRKGIGWSGIVAPIIGFAVFVGLWYLMHYWALEALWDKPSFLITAPHRVVEDSYLEAIPREQMLRGLGWTTFVALTGLGISIVLGMFLAIVMAQATWLERSFWPYLIAAQAVPILAIVPIIGTIFGYGFSSRILVCVIISIFPIVSNTLFGLLSADRSQHDLFTLHDASRRTRLVKLQLPAALPAIFTGFRIAAGLSVIGAVVGELFFRRGSKGIGIVMDQYRQRTQYPLTYGALVLSSLLGIAVFMFFGWLGHAIVGRWHESTRKSS